MTAQPPVTTTAPAIDDEGRPTRDLPIPQLIRLSLYWLGLSSIFASLSTIMQGRIQFDNLVPKGQVGAALFSINIVGSIVAIAVQPTIGSISLERARQPPRSRRRDNTRGLGWARTRAASGPSAGGDGRPSTDRLAPRRLR